MCYILVGNGLCGRRGAYHPLHLVPHSSSKAHDSNWLDSRTLIATRASSLGSKGHTRCFSLLSSRSRDWQTVPEMKAPQCQALSVLSLLSLLHRDDQSVLRPRDTDVAQGEWRPFQPPKIAMLQPRILLWKALSFGPFKI